jgi:hypothetical protein
MQLSGGVQWANLHEPRQKQQLVLGLCEIYTENPIIKFTLFEILQIKMCNITTIYDIYKFYSNFKKLHSDHGRQPVRPRFGVHSVSQQLSAYNIIRV